MLSSAQESLLRRLGAGAGVEGEGYQQRTAHALIKLGLADRMGVFPWILRDIQITDKGEELLGSFPPIKRLIVRGTDNA